MATTINGTTGRNSSHWRYFLICNEQDVSVSGNTSKLKVDVYLGATSYSRAVRGNISATHTINVNGKNYSFTTGAYTIEKNTDYFLGTITTDAIEHNPDGSKTVSVSASSPDLAQASGYGPYSGSASGTVTLTTIARYANLTSLSVSSKTINSITLNYTTDRNAWLFAKLNDGEWLNGGEPFVSNTTSGSFTIYYKDRASTTRLDPNASYKITLLCRALDRNSNLDTFKDISTTTYDIAKLVSVPDVNIGSNQALTWTNPSGATTSLKLCKTDNSQIINYGTVTGTSKSVTPTASTIYALTPNSNTYTARYILTTTANSQSYTNYKDFTFTVTNSNPIFDIFNYADTNNKTVDLTGNSQILIKGYSNNIIMIEEENRASAKNSATMQSYKVVQGSKSATVGYSGGSAVSMTIQNIDNPNMTVYATDSRGNSTSVSKTALYKEYSDVTIKSVTAIRSDNGIGQGVTLKYNGTFWNASFGSVTNAITVKYQYKETSLNTWSSEITLTPTISGNNYSGSVNIQGDLGANGFSVEKSFNIRLIVTDKLITKTYDYTLGAGTPAIAIYKDNVAIGQKYDTSEGSKLQVNGAVKALSINSYFTGIISFACWYHIGNFVFNGQGSYAIIDCYTGVGQNGHASQNIHARILLKQGWTEEALPIGITTKYTQNEDARYKIKINHISKTECSLYIYLPNNYNDLTYIVNGSYLAFTPSNTILSSEPTTDKESTYYYSGIPIQLYGNTSGTNGTIALTESARNFSFLEIYFKNNNDYYGCLKVINPNGKHITLEVNTPYTGGIYIKSKSIYINQQYLQLSDSNTYGEYYIANGSCGASSYDFIYITEVLGYR